VWIEANNKKAVVWIIPESVIVHFCSIVQDSNPNRSSYFIVEKKLRLKLKY
jgi:hypothetical protein